LEFYTESVATGLICTCREKSCTRPRYRIIGGMLLHHRVNCDAGGSAVVRYVLNVLFLLLLAVHSSRAGAWKHVDVTADSFVLARGGGSPNNVADGFTLLSDTVLHDKWRRLTSRKVRLPSGLIADFEIVSQSGHGSSKGTDQAVLIFVWNTSTKTATLVTEYMPATHCKMFGLAAGMVEADKHNEVGNEGSDQEESMQLIAAKYELEEECRLTGGRWIQLTATPVVMDKYCTTAVTAFLVLDPTPVDSGKQKPRDDTEEGMQVIKGVSIAELQRMMTKSAEMTVVGTWATLLALDKLREMGEIE